jgi:[ribosomal protein S18]-alanine N-acetyltransferase
VELLFVGIKAMKNRLIHPLSLLCNRSMNSSVEKESKFKVRPATPQDRQQLANLLHFETHVHRHLDWRPPLDWIGHTPFLVAEQGSQLYGALACPPDPADVAWIRMFAVSSEWSVREAWDALWPVAQAELHRRRLKTVAAIPLQGWLQEVLEESHFQHIHNVVLLLWQQGKTLPLPTENRVAIRPMQTEDLPAVWQVDEAAFGPIWRHSPESLELAFTQSAVATVAEGEGGITGYQISTANPMGGHLARLAVSPGSQGQGTGYSLLVDLLHQFQRRGAVRVTVNTQQDNLASLALYEKAGFKKTGELYPVYQFRPVRRIS